MEPNRRGSRPVLEVRADLVVQCVVSGANADRFYVYVAELDERLRYASGVFLGEHVGTFVAGDWGIDRWDYVREMPASVWRAVSGAARHACAEAKKGEVRRG